MGVGGNINSSGITTILNTTASSSTGTGALVVSGGVGVGGNINSSGITTILNTTESISSITGALTVSGGVGVGKNLFVGGMLGGSLNVSRILSVSYVNVKQSCKVRTIQTLSTYGQFFSVNGGIGSYILSNLNEYINSRAYAFENNVIPSTGDRLLVMNQSNSSQNGIYVVTDKGSPSTKWKLTRTTDADESSEITNMNVYVESSLSTYILTTPSPITIDTTGLTFVQYNSLTNINSINENGIQSTKITLNDTTASSSTGTGALVVSGGVGVGGNINSSGITTILNTTASSSTGTGALVVSGGVGVGGNINSSGITTILNTTASAGPTSGALVVNGGVGSGGDIYSNGIIKILNTTDATGASNAGIGALVVSGGAHISKKLYVYGTSYNTSATWTSTSDIRIKEDIQDADLNICNQIIKNLKLKYYKYKDQYIKPEHRKFDDHVMGFIAQEVKQYLPKSVPIHDQEFNYIDENGEEKQEVIKDLHHLDKDQILMALYGTVQYLQNKLDSFKEENESLKNRLETSETVNQTIANKVQELENELTLIKQFLKL